MTDAATSQSMFPAPATGQHTAHGERGRHAQTRPQPDGQQMQRRRTRPLTDGELNEIMGTAERVPGLGHIMLSLVRNRHARVMVPETPLGGELMQIVSEFDRLSYRAGTLLTRQLSAEKMQAKAAIDLQAVGMIEPLARLTADLANQFDNTQYRIARHSRVRQLQAELRGDQSLAEPGLVTHEGGGHVDGAPAKRLPRPRRQGGEGGAHTAAAAPLAPDAALSGDAASGTPGAVVAPDSTAEVVA